MGRWNTFGKVQARQHPRRHRDRDEHVDDGNSQGRGRKKADDGEEDVPPPAPTRLREGHERDSHRQSGQGHHRQKIEEEAERTRGAHEAHHERPLAVHGAFESRPALADQVVTDVSGPVAKTRFTLSRLGKKNGGLRYLQLGVGTAPRHGFDSVPIAVASKEVLTGVDLRRIEP